MTPEARELVKEARRLVDWWDTLRFIAVGRRGTYGPQRDLDVDALAERMLDLKQALDRVERSR